MSRLAVAGWPEKDAKAWRAQLLRHGYCIIPDLLLGETLARLEADLAPAFAATPFGRGGFYGETTKRFGRLPARSRHVEALVMHPLVREVVEGLLARWCDTLQPNVSQAIAVHPSARQQVQLAHACGERRTSKDQPPAP